MICNHLSTTATIQGRAQCRAFKKLKLPLTNDHLSTTTPILGSQGWLLNTVLTVCYFYVILMQK